MFSSVRMIGGLALVAAIVTAALLWRANGKLHEQIGQMAHVIAQANETNDENVKSLNAIIEKNNQCVESIRVDAERSAKTVSDLQMELISIRSRKPVIQREEVYRDPSCAQLGAIDIAATCPAVADGVRRRASAIGAGGNARGEGGGPVALASRVF